MKENQWPGGCTSECFTLLKHVHSQSLPRFSDRDHRTPVKRVLYTANMAVGGSIWSFLAGMLEYHQFKQRWCKFPRFQPAHSLRRSAHRMPLLDTPLLLLVSEINIANVRLLVSAKTLVYTLIPYLSAVIRRIPYVLALGKLGFNTIHQTIYVAFINCGWICDLLRIEDFIEKGILLGCCGFCLSSRESHTFKQFPAEFAAVNSDDKILK